MNKGSYFNVGDNVSLLDVGNTYSTFIKRSTTRPFYRIFFNLLSNYIHRYRPINIQENLPSYIKIDTTYGEKNDFSDRNDLTWKVIVPYCDSKHHVHLYIIKSNQNHLLVTNINAILKKT